MGLIDTTGEAAANVPGSMWRPCLPTCRPPTPAPMPANDFIIESPRVNYTGPSWMTRPDFDFHVDAVYGISRDDRRLLLVDDTGQKRVLLWKPGECLTDSLTKVVTYNIPLLKDGQ